MSNIVDLEGFDKMQEIFNSMMVLKSSAVSCNGAEAEELQAKMFSITSKIDDVIFEMFDFSTCIPPHNKD